MGITKKKIVLLLLGGAALSAAWSPRRYFRTLKLIGRGWGKIREEEIKAKIRALYRSKLLRTKTEKDGVLTLTLSEKGKVKALRYSLDEMKIKKQQWDGKWRIVIFDVPEGQKSSRDALRFRLKKLGFHELQKSVFVHPSDCQDEINFITEFYQIKPYVRYGLLQSIDNGFHLRQIFGL